jgi:ParB family transcriptional regulator, chromosome partitioning protein
MRCSSSHWGHAARMRRVIPVVFEKMYERAYFDLALTISFRTTRDAVLSNADDMSDGVAWKALEGERETWARLLPKRPDELLAWLSQQDEDTISGLFAFCVAATVDGISHTIHAAPSCRFFPQTNSAQTSAASGRLKK